LCPDSVLRAAGPPWLKIGTVGARSQIEICRAVGRVRRAKIGLAGSPERGIVCGSRPRVLHCLCRGFDWRGRFRPCSPKLRISVDHHVSHLFASTADCVVRFLIMHDRLRFIEHDKSYIVNRQCVYSVGIDRPLSLGLVDRRRCRASWRRWLRLNSIGNAIEPRLAPSARLTGR
jgi:hypothetical protein